MKSLKIIISILIMICNLWVDGQNKYAVLITGNPNPTGDGVVPPEHQWNSGGESNEFWNDTYLLYEILLKFNYQKENIHVMYAGGDPNLPTYYPSRYTKLINSLNNQLGAAEFNGVVNIFHGLQEIMNEHDFLFVWVFSHGWLNNVDGFFYLNDGIMTATQLAGLINPIPAAKKVIWMQPCSGGSFWEKFAGQENVIFSSGAGVSYIANRADDHNQYGYYLPQDYEENDVWDWIPCFHGEFNFHMYSSTNGESPNNGTLYGGETGIPYTEADINNDQVVSVKEAYLWESGLQSQNENPLYGEGTEGLGMKTSLNYPNLVSSLDDLHLNEPNTGIYGITSSLTIPGNNSLVFGRGSKVYLLNDAKIFIQNGATLMLQDNVEIYGKGQNGIYIADGTLQLDQHVVFSSMDPKQSFDGLHLAANAPPTTIDHAVFKSAVIWNECPSLTISNTAFDQLENQWYCAVMSVGGNVTISQSTFKGATVNLVNPNPKAHPEWLAYVHHCNFTNESLAVGGRLLVNGYKNYKIEYNTFDHLFLSAIDICYTGSENSNYHSISQNHIKNCREGIHLCSTIAHLSCNNIHNDQWGVVLGNCTNASLFGSDGMAQNISDCDWEEIYIYPGSFPVACYYNKIVDEDNAGGNIDPLIRYINNPPDPVAFNISYNCWGNQFNPVQDLYGTNVTYNWTPAWCPGNPGPVDPPIDLYTLAISQCDSGNYFSAVSTFKSIVDLYPHSVQAQASLKELFAVEELAGNDYLSLQQYYLTGDSILADSNLTRIGSYLAIRCNEQVENWPDEIAWLENKILNPGSDADSIYAILDLAHVYLLMENNPVKSGYTGALPQYKRVSWKQYLPYHDSLVALLPGKPADKTLVSRLQSLKGGELLQNIPNPVVHSTDIYYKLNVPGDVVLSITDMFNHTLISIPRKNASEGINKATVSLSGLAPGMYYYSLAVSGKIVDTKKLILL